MYSVVGLFWPPRHQREVLAAGGKTLTDTLHLTWAMVTVVLMMLAIGFAAAALGKRFRVYSVASIAMMFGFGMLTSREAPRIEANLPTPWVGVWGRLDIAVFLLWVVVLAITILRTNSLSRASAFPATVSSI